MMIAGGLSEDGYEDGYDVSEVPGGSILFLSAPVSLMVSTMV